MIRTFPLLAAVFGLAGAAPGAVDQPHKLSDMPAGQYTPDRRHTHIYFAYSHVGFSNAHARFDKFDGELNFNPKHPEASKVTFTIDASSLDTNIAELDADLKSAHFFDVAKYPEVKFVMTDLKRTSDTQGVMTGDLTLHGLTKSVALDVTLNKFLVSQQEKFDRFGFTVTGALKRSEWGLGAVPLIGDTVNLTFDVEFLKVVPAAKAN